MCLGVENWVIKIPIMFFSVLSENKLKFGFNNQIYLILNFLNIKGVR
jgi:hypothetical protein